MQLLSHFFFFGGGGGGAAVRRGLEMQINDQTRLPENTKTQKKKKKKKLNNALPNRIPAAVQTYIPAGIRITVDRSC